MKMYNSKPKNIAKWLRNLSVRADDSACTMAQTQARYSMLSTHRTTPQPVRRLKSRRRQRRQKTFKRKINWNLYSQSQWCNSIWFCWKTHTFTPKYTHFSNGKTATHLHAPSIIKCRRCSPRNCIYILNCDSNSGRFERLRIRIESRGRLRGVETRKLTKKRLNRDSSRSW